MNAADSRATVSVQQSGDELLFVVVESIDVSEIGCDEHSFVYTFYEDFHIHNDERLKHAELYKNYTEDYGYLK
uniref:Uncharacterized protein n=1 Tax=Romanomermis culicivorax TaxID=13658 RepID=A0A915J5Q0_ROMCU